MKSGTKWSFGKKLALSILSLPIWLFLGELLSRGWLSLAGRPYDAQQTKAAILRAASQLNDSKDAAVPKEEDLDPALRDFHASWHPQPFYAFEDPTTPAALVELLKLA